MSWNGYPFHVRNSLIKRLKSNQERNETDKEEGNRKIIWLRFPYLGKKGETLLTSLKRKMKRCLKEDVKFMSSYNTKKMAMFCSAKDKIKTTQKANIIMIFSVLLVKNIILVKLINVVLPALMHMEVDMINLCSNTQLIVNSF